MVHTDQSPGIPFFNFSKHQYTVLVIILHSTLYTLFLIILSHHYKCNIQFFSSHFILQYIYYISLVQKMSISCNTTVYALFFLVWTLTSAGNCVVNGELSYGIGFYHGDTSIPDSTCMNEFNQVQISFLQHTLLNLLSIQT